MSVLDELIVQGIRGGASGATSRALSSAISGSIASQVGGMSGLSFGSGANGQALRDAVSRAQGGDPTTVQEVAVNAPRVTPPVGAALASIGGSAAAPAISGGAPAAPTLPPSSQGSDDNVIEGVTVTAPRTLADSVGPALADAVTPPPTFLFPDTLPPDGVKLDTARPGDGMNNDTLGAAEAVAGAGGLGGLAALLGMSPAQLLGTGILGAGLLTGGIGGGGDGKGGPNDPITGLQEIAKNNNSLANRMGSIATAGMSGDIGGKGLNTIARMVRKAQAQIRQRYASMDMSGSTAEMQDLNAAAEAGTDLQFKAGQDMAKTGLATIAALTGQSAAAYASLLNAQTAKDTQLGNILANFAGALVK